MRDKSKKLTVVNTGKKEVATPNLIEKQSSSRPSVLSNTIGISGAEYLLKSIWDSVFEIKTDGSGQKYIYGKLPVVTQYGITMYADNGSLDIPSIYAGLPIDNETLIRDTNGVLMINPNLDLGGGGGASSWDELEGIPSWIGATKPTYQYSEIQNTPDLSKYISSDDLSKYVTLDTEQTIEGKKDFTTGGLFVNGKQIQYDAESGCWKLEGNLLVTGGVTMYADGTTSGGSSAYSTLGSLLNVDDSIDASASVDRVLFQAAGSSQWVTKPLSEIGGSSSGGTVSGDYLPLSGGVLNGKLYFDSTKYVISHVDDSNGGRIDITNLAGSVGFGLFDDGRIQVFKEGYQDILHAGNYSSYALPLSGGTINGAGNYLYVPLFVNALNNQISGITFKTNGTERGHIGYHYELGMRLHTVSESGIAISDSDVPIFYTGNGSVKNTIWHEGNDGAGSGLDADLLDGKQPSALSVLSASKLTTARTIWGQSFDGSGNVNGNLQFNGDYTIQNKSGANVFHAYNGFTIVGYDNCPNKKSTYIDGYGVYLRYGSSWTNGFVLNSVGDVGIGTASPLYKLDVRGIMMCQYMRFNSYTDASKQIGYIGRGSGAVDDLIFSAENGQLRFYTNGNSTSPMTFKNQDLTVPGDVYAAGFWSKIPSGGSYAKFRIISDESSNATWFQSSNYAGTSQNGSIYLSGMSGKNLTLCKVYGPLLATSGITTYSDQRKKTILNHVELSLKQIADAPLIEHYYNSDQEKTTHVGSIAQYWAGINDWFCKLDNEGYYTMEIQNAALASAISIARHLERYESKTDKKIRQLKKRISQLEDELELLKKGA